MNDDLSPNGTRNVHDIIKKLDPSEQVKYKLAASVNQNELLTITRNKIPPMQSCGGAIKIFKNSILYSAALMFISFRTRFHELNQKKKLSIFTQQGSAGQLPPDVHGI